MLRKTIPPIARGQVIGAAWLNKIRQAALRADNRVAGGGRMGMRNESFAVDQPLTAQRLRLVTMTRDAVPLDWPESESVNDLEQTNAVDLHWDGMTQLMTPYDDYRLNVVPMVLPLKEGDKVLVWQHASGLWVPAKEYETELILITNPVPNELGFMEGIVQVWDNNDLRFVNGTLCWVYDANAGTSEAASQIAANEQPAGPVNGVNRTFTLQHSPAPAVSLHLFRDGLLMYMAPPGSGGDFTLDGNVITFAEAPAPGTILEATYQFRG